jgi:hypothetical protein
MWEAFFLGWARMWVLWAEDLRWMGWSRMAACDER